MGEGEGGGGPERKILVPLLLLSSHGGEESRFQGIFTTSFQSAEVLPKFETTEISESGEGFDLDIGGLDYLDLFRVLNFVFRDYDPERRSTWNEKR
jgi:hypothetical protein